MKALMAQLNYTVGDFQGNTEKILESLKKARQEGADLAVFSEMALCGYPPEDLLSTEGFVEEMGACLQRIVEASQGLFVVLGVARKNPVQVGKKLCNSAAVISDGKLLGFHDKWLLPTYDVFDEARYFEPGSTRHVWEHQGKKIGLLICEDMWQHAHEISGVSYARDPVGCLASENLDLLINLSASPYHLRKHELRLKVCQKAAQFLSCPLLLCCQVGGNDELIFDGYSLQVGSDGELLSLAKGFEEDLPIWQVGEKSKNFPLCLSESEELFKALSLGLRDYFHKSGLCKACLGLSGGIDSAVVACLAVSALGKENVLALSMPSRYSSSSSKTDAKALAETLGIVYEEISIEPLFDSYLTLLGPYFSGLPWSVAEENLQARIRGVILMAFSNKFGHVLLSTSNKSELAVGYTTLYGDLCGGLSVIADLKKGQVYEMARWVNRTEQIIPRSTLEKEPSAELREHQKDTDSLPPYEVLDAVVRGYVELGKSAEAISREGGIELSLVQELVHKIHRAEYKRRQAPPLLRVSPKSFRAGRKVPIVQKWE